MAHTFESLQDACFDAFEAVQHLSAEFAIGVCRTPEATAALLARQADAAAQITSAYRAIVLPMVADAYAGDAFSRAFIAGSFGDLEFSPEGEESGHERVLPADPAVVQARIAAVTWQHALGALRNIGGA